MSDITLSNLVLMLGTNPWEKLFSCIDARMIVLIREIRTEKLRIKVQILTIEPMTQVVIIYMLSKYHINVASCNRFVRNW